MPPAPNVLRLRREYSSKLADVLAAHYRALKVVEGMSDDDAQHEVIRMMESWIENLGRMGIPPAWMRPALEDEPR